MGAMEAGVLTIAFQIDFSLSITVFDLHRYSIGNHFLCSRLTFGFISHTLQFRKRDHQRHWYGFGSSWMLLGPKVVQFQRDEKAQKFMGTTAPSFYNNTWIRRHN
ncbi:hypothetical protein RJT34_16056 [Clitoria ternatea]|uniref:Uncharacterized protein n=1 Tax=Clitoria ternatea TaxID=43366 RepID=A0AAN9PBZ8_CLITE